MLKAVPTSEQKNRIFENYTFFGQFNIVFRYNSLRFISITRELENQCVSNLYSSTNKKNKEGIRVLRNVIFYLVRITAVSPLSKTCCTKLLAILIVGFTWTNFRSRAQLQSPETNLLKLASLLLLV